MSPLHVVTMVSNPVRYESRYRLYRQFVAHMAEFPDVKLYTAEIAYGHRPFAVTEAGNSQHLQLRTSSEIWHKEQAMNLVVKRLLPPDAQYIAFADADIHFQHKDWAAETVHQLQHYDVVQCFTDALDLGPRGEILDAQRPRRAFCYQYHQSLLGRDPPVGDKGHYAAYWHPGYAWAMTRDAYNRLGGLLDICIVGSADYHMAMGLIGKGRESLWQGVSQDYADTIMRWCDNAALSLKRNVGYVHGAILHHWHGKKSQRGYLTREEILVRRQFAPARHLHLDSGGLYRLIDEGGELRDEIRFYFRARNEDSIDLD